ncbi:MAG: hypothetical protein DI551_06190 [Micavibrio aeruginosavorus]|uniref:Ancillary SecYEG translocon subunit/Cell division coordinator CpoB TPR domain-containing protein n=1 Tax=Micavibrio aeruginosavorus TaxID=349221 RepID=A0A2W5Q3J2_9BACT|nr:MAG: hypothetical protein DI551_06190 [Micavibrio aeruginosavorus]
MSDIFREVDEALQREKVAKLWKTYGPTLLLAAIVLVLGTAATTAYKSWKTHENRAETAKLITAAEDKDIAAGFEKAAGETKGEHKSVALLNAASKYADKKNFTKATELYDAVSRDQSAPSDLRDIANIYYARSAMLAAPDKTPDFKGLIARIEPVANNSDSAFRLQAKLDTALLYGNGLKDYAKALTLLTGFDEAIVPDSLKEKALALKNVYEYEQSQKAPVAASAQKQPE